MRNANLKKGKNRLIRAVISVTFAVILLLSLTIFASAEDVSSFDASFNGTNYETLSEAINAANSAGGGEITLLRDINLAESLTISSNITLKGSHTIYRADTYTAGLFVVNAGATLTLDGGITIDGGNEWVLTDDFMADLNAGIPVSRTGDYYVVPEEGAPVGSAYMINVFGAVIMNNATVCNNYTTSNKAAVFYLNNEANLTTNSGAVLKNNCSTSNNPLINSSATGNWTINDGTEIYGHYAGSNGGLSYMTGQVTMNGGDIHDNYLNCGAGTLFMLYGTGSLTMNGGHVHHNYNIPNGTSSGGVIYVHYGNGGGTFTMNGGVIEKNYGINNTGIQCNGSTSKVYLNGGVLRHEVSTNPDCSYDSQLRGTVVIGEDMVIEGGRIRIRCTEITVDGTVDSDILWYLALNSLEGSPIEQSAVSGSGTFSGNLSIRGDTALTINGCTWLGTISVAEIATLSITGGSFRENPSEWIGDAYGAIYDPETEMYNVVETAKASINGVEYNSIAEAVAAANDGDTILIMASHRIRNGVDIDKDVTIDMNNQSIISADTVDVAFRVLANVSLNGNGSIDTDNGITDVFEIGDDTVEGSLTIANGRYVGENSVAALVNGSLIIDGGEFAVNPDVADGETPDCSKLIDVDVSSADGAKKEVLVKGGSFHRFNPGDVDTSTGSENFVDENYDSIESGEDIFSVITHSFTEYFSDNNATCEHDGTKTAKCDNCDTIHTIVDEGTGGHRFSVYISDQNSTCQSKGTKTAKCDRCDATDTQEGDKYGRHQYKGVKCQNCSRGQITQLIIIAMAIGVGGFAVWFMGFDRMFRPF